MQAPTSRLRYDKATALKGRGVGLTGSKRVSPNRVPKQRHTDTHSLPHTPRGIKGEGVSFIKVPVGKTGA